MASTKEHPLLTLIGFGAGNGLGIARAFGAAGFRLALLSRSPEKQSDSVRQLNDLGIALDSFAADAANPESLSEALAAVGGRCGATDVLVYNAFAPRFGRPTTMTPAGLIDDLKVGVVGAFTATMGVLPAMKARKAGTILFTGGGWAMYPSVDAASISLAKAALRNLAFTLSEELRGTGVRVGTLTIMGVVAAGTPFNPDAIGRAFFDYYKTSDSEFQPEVLFKGSA